MTHRILLFSVMAAMVGFAGSRVNSEVIYVDVRATGPALDGTSWCTGFLYLQDALALASPSDTIRVAHGMYKPDQGFGQLGGNRSASFHLETGVSLEGGFAGCGAVNPDARDFTMFETVLSGDVNDDDATGEGNTLENSYHVVTANSVGSSAVLDGFTIMSGNADGSDPDNRGGGLYSSGGQPTIRNCVFRENRGRFGGAINNDGSHPTISNTVFLGNGAGFSGGAIRGWQSSANLENCLFAANTAEAGGAVWFGASTPTFEHCTFADNAAPAGNAIAFDSCCPQQPSSAEFTNCILWNGVDEISNEDSSTFSVTYSIVEGGLTGIGNIDADPLFVPGPIGCYYLSQVAAGHFLNSPGLNAGDNTAANLGLNTRTTRSDEAVDTGVADLGYHFPSTGRDLVMGDADRNLTLDLHDVASLQQCYSGEGVSEVSPCCRIFDLEPDSDIDLSDSESFVLDITGP